MDRTRMAQDLAHIEEHVRLSQLSVAKQEHILTELQRTGQDRSIAEALQILRALRASLAVHQAERDRLQAHLQDAASQPECPLPRIPST